MFKLIGYSYWRETEKKKLGFKGVRKDNDRMIAYQKLGHVYVLQPAHNQNKDWKYMRQRERERDREIGKSFIFRGPHSINYALHKKNICGYLWNSMRKQFEGISNSRAGSSQQHRNLAIWARSTISCEIFLSHRRLWSQKPIYLMDQIYSDLCGDLVTPPKEKPLRIVAIWTMLNTIHQGTSIELSSEENNSIISLTEFFIHT